LRAVQLIFGLLYRPFPPSFFHQKVFISTRPRTCPAKIFRWSRMEERKIICPYCKKEMEIELVLQNIQKLEMGIGIKVRKPKEEKEKSKGK
jgi:hypothetical protein